tara:strand:- start:87 stop:596 length:510 start_codon:yes stop_codon:yes gene_type:complete
MKTQFRLHKSDQRDYEFDGRYWFQALSKSHYREWYFNLLKVIKKINTELDWKDCPDINEFKKRLEFDSVCHLWMFEDKPLGWHWTNHKHITIDWKSSYRLLEDNRIYTGGAFLSKEKPEASSAIKFYRQGIRYSFDYYRKDVQYLYNDDWNRASSLLSRQVGFTEYKFL